MIIFTVRNDFYIEGKIEQTYRRQGRPFSLNRVDDGWTLALDLRFKGVYPTLDSALSVLTDSQAFP